MGRIFEKRKHRMFARWAKNAKAFTKVGKEIAIAVRLGGEDPNTNPRLRAAVQTGRGLNMPKDRIDAAIHRASSKDETNYEEVTYEAYGPHGVAIFIETATDNTTRTIGNIRSMFNRYGGSIGTNGCLNFVFDRKGVFTINKPGNDKKPANDIKPANEKEGFDMDELELDLIDAGLEDIFEIEEGLMVYTSFKDYLPMQKALEEKKLDIISSSLQRIPTNYTEISDAQREDVQKLIDAIEEDDDVQHVFHTMKD